VLRSKLLIFLLSFFTMISAVWIGRVSAQNAVPLKKAVMVIPHNAFRDEELSIPERILEDEGIDVEIASSSRDEAKGMLGTRVKPDMLLDDINMHDYDAIIFVGGQGATEYWNNPLALRLARDAVAFNKIVGAICIAPVTLANAGILNGRRATVSPSEAGRLEAAGAVYTGSPLEKDGNIITASGPEAANDFGISLLKAIKY
jgi:protease I